MYKQSRRNTDKTQEQQKNDTAESAADVMHDNEWVEKTHTHTKIKPNHNPQIKIKKRTKKKKKHCFISLGIFFFGRWV